MRLVASLLTLTLTLSMFADAKTEVAAAETAFAKAFADRDKAKFFSFVADDAVFLSALGTLRGKEHVVSRWSRFFEGPEAPFSWGPERVEITAGGTIGFSMGPIYDPQGNHAGYYSSIWQKQGDGTWKVVVDGPGNPPAPLPESTAKLEEGHIPTPDGVKLYYRKLGGGPITLVVPLDYALHAQFRQFADIATVITYDPRNRGRSSRAADEATWTIQQDVADLETVRAHFKAEKIVPIGYSYLGKVVAMYAAAHPQHVARLVQLGPGANDFAAMPSRPPGDTGVPAEDVAALQKMREAGEAEKNPRAFCDAYWKVMRYTMVGNPERAPLFTDTGCDLENEQGTNFNRTFAKLWPTIQAAKLSDAELQKITMPVLVIHGTKDRNALYEGGQAWAASLPNARLLTIPGGAHAMWIDDPIATFGAIRHFLRGEWPLG